MLASTLIAVRFLFLFFCSQSFPLEIMAYPGLAKKGAWLDEQKKPLVYRQETVRSLVEYARQRAIRVVPEVDFPSHMGGLALAMPNVTGKPKEMRCVIQGQFLQSYKEGARSRINRHPTSLACHGLHHVLDASRSEPIEVFKGLDTVLPSVEYCLHENSRPHLLLRYYRS